MIKHFLRRGGGDIENTEWEGGASKLAGIISEEPRKNENPIEIAAHLVSGTPNMLCKFNPCTDRRKWLHTVPALFSSGKILSCDVALPLPGYAGDGSIKL